MYLERIDFFIDGFYFSLHCRKADMMLFTEIVGGKLPILNNSH